MNVSTGGDEQRWASNLLNPVRFLRSMATMAPEMTESVNTLVPMDAEILHWNRYTLSLPLPYETSAPTEPMS